MNNSYLLLFASMIFLGVSNIFFQKSTQIIGPINTTWWYYIFGLLLSTVIYLVSEKPVITDYTAIKWPFFVALFLVMSVCLFNFALQKINVSIASTVRSLSFITTILLSFYFSEEVLSSRQLLGMVLGIGSILLMK